MQFIHMGFLAAGAIAMTLPIWIHLLLRQRARPMQIGSVRFLQAVVRRSKRRQRIRRWLLLALRCLAVLLLGLLFARPYLPAAPADGRTREAVILIDRSASMLASVDGSQSPFDDAVEYAREHIESLGEQSRIQIGLFDGGGVESIPIDELDDAEAGYASSNFAEAFSWAADVLAASSRVDRSLLLLSDLQAAGLQAEPPQPFPADIPVEIVDVGRSATQNLAIESVQPAQVELRPGVPVALAVRFYNAGALPVNEVSVEFVLNGPAGDLEFEETLTLGAGSRTSREIVLDIEEAGLYQGYALIKREDSFSWDSRRWMAFEVRRPDRVLLVDGEPGRTEYANETYYLETALRLQTPVGDAPARTFEVERLVWERGEGFPDLDGFRLVILANPGRFTTNDASRLRQFMDDGGNVLLFCGERTTPAVLEPMQEAGLVPRGAVPSPRDAFARVTEFDEQHPVLLPFADPQHGDLRRLTVKRYLPLSQWWSSAETNDAAVVLLKSRDEPLIVERPVGAGRLILMATTADRDWNDWPQGRLYVPLVRQLAAYLTGRFDPRQPVQSELIESAGVPPGITEDDETLLVRNTDPRESEPGRVTPEQFREAIGLPEAPRSELDKQAQALAPAGVMRSDEHWPLVVWLLLAVLGIETLLASRVVE